MSESGDLQWDDDLLSGYLDGELTEEQRRLVRDRLASDPLVVDLLKQLQKQREETLKSAGAIPVPDLTRRIQQRLAVEIPTAIPSTKGSSQPGSSRGAWRFAAALLAASLAGILIGPWFLRSRTEVSLQSPAPASSSTQLDGAAHMGGLEFDRPKDIVSGNSLPGSDSSGDAALNLPQRLEERLEESVASDRKLVESDLAKRDEEMLLQRDRSESTASLKDEPAAEKDRSMPSPEALGFSTEQADRFGSAAGLDAAAGSPAAAGALGGAGSPGFGKGFGSSDARGGLAGGGMGAKAAPGAPPADALNAAPSAGMAAASRQPDARGSRKKQQKASSPAPARVAGEEKMKDLELRLHEGESLNRFNDDWKGLPRKADGPQVLGESAEIWFDGLLRSERLEAEGWQSLRVPTDPKWIIQLDGNSWVLDVPAFFWPTLYQRMVQSGWSVQDVGVGPQDEWHRESNTAVSGNPRLPRVDNPQSVELEESLTIWIGQSDR